MDRDKIVLPGGAGLVGRNLLARLLQRGHRNVVVIDKHGPNLQALREMHPSVQAIEADLAESGPWRDAFRDARAVVMLQAQIGGKHADVFVRNNLTATENVLDAMRAAQVPYLVHVSSSVVESVASDDYTRTKAAQEELVRAAGFKHVVLRPTLMFGWFDRKHLGWLSRFMKRVPIFPIPGHGKYMRQPLYAGDFCAVILRCLETQHQGEPLNISGVERIYYVDMMRAIRDAVGARTWLLHVPSPLFGALLDVWGAFDANPPFTSTQLKALTAGDEFEEFDWPGMFELRPTPFAEAIAQTFHDPQYSHVVLEF